MSEDVVSLGVSMDTGPLVQGSLALKRVSESADDASKSSEKFSSATKQVNADVARMISVNENLQQTVKSLSGDVSKLTIAMNDNAAAVTKIGASHQAANDNIRKTSAGLTDVGNSAVKSGKSIIDTGVEILKIYGYLKLGTTAAFAFIPGLRGLVDTMKAGSSTTLGPALSAAASGMSMLGAAATKAGVPVAAITAGTTQAAVSASAFYKIYKLFDFAGLATASVGTQAIAVASMSAKAGLKSLASEEVSVIPKTVSEGLKAIPTALGTIGVTAITVGKSISGFLTPALAFATKLLIPILAIVGAWEALKSAVDLANERIEKSVELQKKANEIGFGVEAIQRMEMAAKKAGIEVESLTNTMKKFREATEQPLKFELTTDKEKIGLQKSAFDERLKELTDLKNFQKNSFLDEVKNAQNLEDKYRATIKFLREAGAQNERMAALNLASTFASPKVMEQLKANLGFLEDTQKAADAIAEKDLLKQEDVTRALDLKERLEKAEAILHERWLPTQNLITEAGIQMKEMWVKIIEGISFALGLLNSFGSKLLEIASIPVKAGGALWSSSVRFLRDRGIIELDPNQKEFIGPNLPAPGQSGFIGPVTNPGPLDRSDNALRARIETMNKLMDQIKDKSKLLKDTKDEESKAWDKEVKSIEKHNAALQADALAVGRSESEHAALRAEMQLLRAAQEDGLGVTKKQIEAYIKARETLTANEAIEKAGINLGEKRKKQFDDLRMEAELRTRILNIKKIDNEISFARKTAFLTSDDAAIAEKLKTVFGNDVPKALASSQAEAMRFNNALKELNTQAGEFASGFLKDLANGVDPMKALGSAASKLRDTLIDMSAKKLSTSILSGIDTSIGGGGTSGVTAAASSAAATLNSAASSMYKSMVSGATEAASIFGLTIPPAAETLAAGGVAGGAAVESGGVAGGAALEAGGAAAGVAMMGPLALIMAGIVAAGAIATSFLGKAKREREEAQALQKANQAAASLSGQLGGQGVGSVVQKMTDMNLQVMTALQAFHGAVTAQSVQLNKDMQEFFVRTVNDFRNNWEQSLAQLGDNSQFSQARANVAALGKTILDFVNDTRTLGTADQTSRAQSTGRDTLLAMLATPKTLSATATELQRISGVAAGLQPVLMTLGMTAEQAAAQIKKGVDEATAALKSTFTKDLTRQLNDALGKGFVNELSDLLDQINQMRTDAASLGGGQETLIDRVLGARAQKIVDDANLTGAAFQDLLNTFPQLTNVVHEATAALDDQKRAQDQAARSIVDYVNGLMGGSSSTLSPMNKLRAAQSTFNTTLGLAQAGNPDALNRVTSDFENVRQAAMSVFGSSAKFQQILQEGIDQLLALPAVQGSTDPVVQALLTQTQQFVDAITGTTTAVTQVNTTTGTVATNTGGMASALNGITYNTSQTATNTGSIGNISAQTGSVVANTGTMTSLMGANNQGLGAITANTGNTATSTSVLPAISGQATYLGGYLPSINANVNSTNLSTSVLPSIANYANQTATNTGSIGAISISTGAAANLLNANNNSGIGSIVINTGNAATYIGSNDNEGTRGILSLLTRQLTSSPLSAQLATNTGVANFTLTNNNVIDALNKIVLNTFAISLNTFTLAQFMNMSSNGSARLTGTYAAGGTIPPYGLGLVSEHLNPTFLRAGADPVHVFPGSPANDNGIVQELRALRRDSADQNFKVAQLISMLCTLTGQSREEIVGAIDDQTSSMKRDSNQDRNNPQLRAAGR